MANFTSTHTGSVVDAAVTKITATSSSATELNILDGVTATTAEINILDGVTATTAELNILDGVTSTAAELNVLDGYTGSVTELNYLDTLHATGVTATEFDYLDGVTSNIQTQLDAKIEATLTSEQVQDIVGAMFSSNTESGITVSYEDGDGTIDLTVATQSDNNFTTTLLNKLNAIEASADVTDTANVTSAGALMDSEVSNLSFVKGLTKGISDGNVLTANDAVADNDFLRIDGTEVEGRTAAEVRSDLNVEDGATADQTASEIKTLVDSASDSNVFTDADHSKLDGIEASATADQTNAEIRTAVEAASDSNVFTDADHSKLNAIEASADVTDTANVTSAGALMDSELTSIADVKALDQSVVSGASPTFGTANMTDASNKRFMTDAQETKLDSVESNATADQTDEEIQDVVGAMFSGNTETGITATYQDGDGTIDLVVGTLNQDTTGNAATATKIASITNSDIVQLTDTQTLTNKTLTSPVINTGVSGSAILDEDDMTSNSSTKLSTQQSIKAYVDAEVAGVVDTAPAALNTLNELAAALGDDANFSTTTSTALGNRLRVDTASQGLTGTQQANAITNLGITSTKAELNILDGVTSTAAELNILDGVTSTAAELNVLDGITSTTAELNILDGVTATAAELNIMDGVTATTAELNYVDGVTSNIQTQLDATLDTAGTGIDISSTTISVDVSDFMANGADNRVLTATGADAMNAEANLTFDGSTLSVTGDLTVDDITINGSTISDSGNFTIDVGGDMSLDSANGVFRLKDGGTEFAKISENSNNLRIFSTISDADILLQVNDGGSTITALQIDASNVGQVKLPNDNQELRIGASADLALWHNGSNSYIENTATGNLYITNAVDDADVIFQSDDGSGGVTPYLTLDGSAERTVFDKHIRVNDNVEVQIGSAGDMPIYHNGTNSLIDNYTGSLIIQTRADDEDIILKSDDGSGGVTAYLTLDGSSTRTNVHKDLRLDNSVNLSLGGGGNMSMSHDGSNATFSNATGNLTIQTSTDDGDVIFRCDDGSGGLTTYITLDGSAGLTQIDKDMKFVDGVDAHFGSSSDFQITHDGSNTDLTNATGDLKFTQYADDGDIRFFNDDGSGGTTEYFRLDGGTGHLNLTPPNNVGIGTTSPSYKLDITHAGSGLRLNSSADQQLRFERTSGNAFSIEHDTARIYLYNRTTSAAAVAVDNAGNFGIGTVSPSMKLNISHGDQDGLRFTAANTHETFIDFGDTDDNDAGSIRYDHNDNSLAFRVNASESARIDSSGRLVVGNNAAVATVGGTGHSQVLGTGNSDTVFTIGRFSNNTGVGQINFLKSRNGTIGSNTIVQDDDGMGAIVWAAADGSDFVSHAAKIDARIDGTPGANDTPGRLIFYTTADGSDSAVERVRIDSAGNMRFSDNASNPSASSNMAFIFNDGGEMKVLDELGNTTTISPHNFELIPEGASEDMAWSHHSVKGNKTVNVDMMKLARLVEELTGEKLVYTEET
jgi:hypothetical protein